MYEGEQEGSIEGENEGKSAAPFSPINDAREQE
jgi:hypothetical protein